MNCGKRKAETNPHLFLWLSKGLIFCSARCSRNTFPHLQHYLQHAPSSTIYCYIFLASSPIMYSVTLKTFRCLVLSSLPCCQCMASYLTLLEKEASSLDRITHELLFRQKQRPQQWWIQRGVGWGWERGFQCRKFPSTSGWSMGLLINTDNISDRCLTSQDTLNSSKFALRSCGFLSP